MNREIVDRDWEIFSYNVAWLRKNHGLTTKQMAALLGIGVRTLTRIENGELPPRLMVDVFFCIQDHFRIHPAEQLSKRLGE